jgi:phosphoribosylanthranilate isomerase
MMWIKICGITNLEDAQSAIAAGADALGFVFHPHSQRKTEVRTAKAMAAQLPESIEKIGVFGDQPGPAMAAICESAGLTGAQLHFTRAPEGGPKALWRPSLKKYLALPAALVSAGVDPSCFMEGTIDALFLDSGTTGQPGGTGRTFDWKGAESMVGKLSQRFRVVVAGGLNPKNVADAIRILKPWGVDVSSGVEAAPGKKDPQKIRDFIDAVRQVEVSV